jgi:hypothetical protein
MYNTLRNPCIVVYLAVSALTTCGEKPAGPDFQITGRLGGPDQNTKRRRQSPPGIQIRTVTMSRLVWVRPRFTPKPTYENSTGISALTGPTFTSPPLSADGNDPEGTARCKKSAVICPADSVHSVLLHFIFTHYV